MDKCKFDFWIAFFHPRNSETIFVRPFLTSIRNSGIASAFNPSEKVEKLCYLNFPCVSINIAAAASPNSIAVPLSLGIIF
jgi:hypothetical protein